MSLNVTPSQPIILEPSRGWVTLNLRKLWQYRELLYFLSWRDIKVRYKQTLLGAAWAIMQPVLTMLLFSVFFGKLAKMPSDGIPYPLFAYTALVPWTLFANALTQSSNSLVQNANLLKKVYFPRLVTFMNNGSVSTSYALARGFGLQASYYLGILRIGQIFVQPQPSAIPVAYFDTTYHSFSVGPSYRVTPA